MNQSPTKRVRKAVIPAAGLGTRFLPATKAQPKEMLPLVDKPAIQYVVEEAVRAGLDDILIITGRNKKSMEDHFDRSVELEHELEQRGKAEELAEIRALSALATIHYVRQGEPLGLGHAVSVAQAHVGEEPFAVLLGDDIIHERSGLLAGMIDAYQRTGSSVVALLEVAADQISSYGCARVESAELAESSGGADDADANLFKVLEMVEKPKAEEAPSNLAIMGRYVFTPAIFDAIDKVSPGVGGEIQLTDAMVLLLGWQDLYGYRFTEGRFDTGKKLDWLQATVELACERDDLGPAFRAWLGSFVRQHGL